MNMTTIAHCQRCGMVWSVPTEIRPDLLEGSCMECQKDSDVERPLVFGLLLCEDASMEELPEGSLVE